MANLTLNDVLLQKIRFQANIQNIPLEQFVTNVLQKQLTEQPVGTCKPKRIGRYHSGRDDISVQAKTISRQLMKKKHERYR